MTDIGQLSREGMAADIEMVSPIILSNARGSTRSGVQLLDIGAEHEIQLWPNP